MINRRNFIKGIAGFLMYAGVLVFGFFATYIICLHTC